MIDEIVKTCPECDEHNPEALVHTSIWFECKTCNYCEDSFKGPSLFRRYRDSNGPLIQYL